MNTKLQVSKSYKFPPIFLKDCLSSWIKHSPPTVFHVVSCCLLALNNSSIKASFKFYSFIQQQSMNGCCQSFSRLIEYASPAGIHGFKHTCRSDVLSGTGPAEVWLSVQLTYDGVRSSIRRQGHNDKVTKLSIGPV